MNDIDVANVRFRTTRMGEGYDEAEVDAFLDRIGAVLDGDHPAPPGFADEVAGATFRVVRFGAGYDMGEVDAFLDRVVRALRAGDAPAPRAPSEPMWNAAVARSAGELTDGGDRPAGERFDRAGWFSSGYAPDQVDPFVDQVRAQIGRPQPNLRAHQLDEVRFTTERRGYVCAAVDDWLARVCDHLRERGLP